MSIVYGGNKHLNRYTSKDATQSTSSASNRAAQTVSQRCNRSPMTWSLVRVKMGYTPPIMCQSSQEHHWKSQSFGIPSRTKPLSDSLAEALSLFSNWPDSKSGSISQEMGWSMTHILRQMFSAMSQLDWSAMMFYYSPTVQLSSRRVFVQVQSVRAVMSTTRKMWWAAEGRWHPFHIICQQ